ncbi:hypothetical protein UB46_12950 [Burkholderiaceae bacterium 16]|nr:hypothetical protein UB46_12950 [Burkholderiaceae bacterium 16]
MLTDPYAVYNGHAYQIEARQVGDPNLVDAKVQVAIRVSKVDAQGKPTGPEKVIWHPDGFDDFGAATRGAERYIKTKIDDGTIGL